VSREAWSAFFSDEALRTNLWLIPVIETQFGPRMLRTSIRDRGTS